VGRLLILTGTGILLYDHYYGISVPLASGFAGDIISLVAFSLIGIGAIMYFLTDLK
jgi:hypothetical protein